MNTLKENFQGIYLYGLSALQKSILFQLLKRGFLRPRQAYHLPKLVLFKNTYFIPKRRFFKNVFKGPFNFLKLDFLKRLLIDLSASTRWIFMIYLFLKCGLVRKLFHDALTLTIWISLDQLVKRRLYSLTYQLLKRKFLRPRQAYNFPKFGLFKNTYRLPKRF